MRGLIPPLIPDRPHRDEWVAMLDRTIVELQMLSRGAIVLVAHGLGCSLVAHWSRTPRDCVVGAFMVAPPNITKPDITAGQRFHPLPLSVLPMPSLVVASDLPVDHLERGARVLLHQEDFVPCARPPG